MPKVYGPTFFLSIPTYIDKVSDTTITTTLHLDRFGVRTINAVRRALNNDITAFMSNSMAGAIYKALCQEYDLTQAYVARTASDHGHGGRTMYIENGKPFYEELAAANLLCKPVPQNGRTRYSNINCQPSGTLTSWSCYVPPVAVQKFVQDHRPNSPAKVARAVAHLDALKPIDYIYSTGGYDAQ